MSTTIFRAGEAAGRTLRADRLVWLLTDPDAKALVSHRGLQIANAEVEGELDLMGMDFAANLVLENWQIQFRSATPGKALTTSSGVR